MIGKVPALGTDVDGMGGSRVAFSARLALPAADIVFDDLGLGRAPQPFEIPVVGETLDERARLREASQRTLRRHGLMHGGRLDSRLEDVLVTLVRAPFAITLAGDVGGPVVLARAASDGRDAVLAHQQGNLLVLTEVRPTSVVAEAVGMLPRIRAGQGASMRMPAPGGAQPAPADDDFSNPLASARARTSAPPQERGLARVFGQPRLGLGVIAASARTGEPPRWRRLCQLSWWDFDQEDGAGPGRWFSTVDGDPPQLNLHPRDSARIAQYLHQLVDPHLP